MSDTAGASSHLPRLAPFFFFPPHRLSPAVIASDLGGDSELALTADGPADVWRDAQVN